MNAREIIEAESPKKTFSQATSLPSWLRQHGFAEFEDGFRFQSNRLLIRVKAPVDHGDGTETPWNLNVMANPDGFPKGHFVSAENTFYANTAYALRELMSAIETYFRLYEAESPKNTFKRITDPTNLEQQLKRIQREEEIEATPREDSWARGQRIQRTRHGPFGPRPYGGDPNDIGDLGTVLRFLKREPDPRRAEYLVRWDRNQLGSHYITHRDAEAIPGEIVNLDAPRDRR